MTTSRMVVVLRSELGKQLSLIHIERKTFRDNNPELEADMQLFARGSKCTKKIKEYLKIGHRASRLERAIEALGNIQLGDIEEDREL